MNRQKTNKKKHERDSGWDSLLLVIFRRALLVWERYKGHVPTEVLLQLEKEGDWPEGVAASAIARLSRDKKLRQQLREP
jgi:hypothetical protein